MFFSLPELSLLGMLVANALVLAAPVPNMDSEALQLYSRGANSAAPCVAAKVAGKKGKRCEQFEVPTTAQFMTYMADHMPANTALFYSLPKTDSADSYRAPIEKYASDHALHSLWTMVDPNRMLPADATSMMRSFFWHAASDAFAQAAMGTVYVLMEAGATKSPDVMWNTVEWPVLEKRLKAKEITAVKVLRQGKAYTNIATQSEPYVHRV